MRNVAIVDDDEVFLSLTANSIRKICEVDVNTYHRGACLMRALHGGYLPDAIIVDEMLEGGYGHVVVREVRDWGFKGAIICVSEDFRDMKNKGAQDLATMCVQAGASFVMPKYDPRQICLRLRDATDALVKMGYIPVQGNRRVG